MLPAGRAARRWRVAGTEAAGAPALVEVAARPAEMMVAAIVGCAGLAPTMAAIEQGDRRARQQRSAGFRVGEVMMAEVARHGTTLLPMDSEHNAIFQCLCWQRSSPTSSCITLTASGGPFRDWSPRAAGKATPAQAVKHLNWDMGAKISVDPATMFNKGLELIEAFHLFPVGLERLALSSTRSRWCIRWWNIAMVRRWPSWGLGAMRVPRPVPVPGRAGRYLAGGRAQPLARWAN